MTQPKTARKKLGDWFEARKRNKRTRLRTPSVIHGSGLLQLHWDTYRQLSIVNVSRHDVQIHCHGQHSLRATIGPGAVLHLTMNDSALRKGVYHLYEAESRQARGPHTVELQISTKGEIMDLDPDMKLNAQGIPIDEIDDGPAVKDPTHGLIEAPDPDYDIDLTEELS